jgi:hypothetical protein
MKKTGIILAVLMFFSSTLFAQTAVSVPSQFAGTWSAEVLEETLKALDIQSFMIMEISKNGTWVLSVQFFAYSQQGRDALGNIGMKNGYTQVASSGVVTAANSVEIVLAQLGANEIFDRGTLDSNNRLVFSDKSSYWTRGEPQPRQ